MTREALVDGDRRFTWTQVGAEVDRAAKAFLAAGIAVGGPGGDLGTQRR